MVEIIITVQILIHTKFFKLAIANFKIFHIYQHLMTKISSFNDFGIYEFFLFGSIGIGMWGENLLNSIPEAKMQPLKCFSVCYEQRICAKWTLHHNYLTCQFHSCKSFVFLARCFIFNLDE